MLYRARQEPFSLTVKYPLTIDELSTIIGEEMEVSSAWVHFYFEGEKLNPTVLSTFLF